jgi:hypothetical protein
MKYITLEKNEYYLKILHELNLNAISSFWIYEIFKVEDDINLSQELQDVVLEITEDMVKGSCFSHINLSQRKTTNVKVEQGLFEWVKHTFDIPKGKTLNPRDKFTYTITEEDEKNSVAYIKAILLHYMKRQFDTLSEGNKLRYNKKYNRITESINACQTNDELHVIMHEHFDYAFMVHDPETKYGTTKPGSKWDLLVPTQKRVVIGPITEEQLDSGPTIDNIDPNVFELKWEIGEPIEVKL